MVAENMTVDGRRFRTQADYEAALRDKKKIDAIRTNTDLNDAGQLTRLFGELQSGSYRFETAIGNDFDDEIFDKYEALKAGTSVDAQNKTTAKNEKTKKKGNKQTVRNNDGVKTKSTGELKRIQSSNNKNITNGSNDISLDKYDKEMQEQILRELKKRERRRKMIVILASVVAVACFGYFGIYYFYSVRTNMDYEALADLKGSEALLDVETPNDFTLHKSTVKLPDILDEYKTLYEKNKKLIGWLQIDDTIIDYPVMQTSNNEYYLEHNFNQEYDKNGSLFLDYECNIYPRSTNLIIYGHHMKSGQMFGQLQKYAKESYGKKHSTITFDSIYEKATYEVMYVFRSQVYKESDIVFKYYQFIDANSEEEFNSYMKEMAAMSLYDTGVTASFGDSLLTLSTCDHSQEDGRFVVVAKRIK